MKYKAIQTASVTIVKQQSLRIVDDIVAVEEPLEIWLKHFNGSSIPQVDHLCTIMRTPGADEALVRGWLFTTARIDQSAISGVNASGTQRLKGQSSNRLLVTLKPNYRFSLASVQRADIANSSCGVCGQQSIEKLLDDIAPINPSHQVSFSPAEILTMPLAMRRSQSLFDKTGGNHAAALVNRQGQIIDIFEDVGRHNALDKLIGHNFQRFPGQYAVLLSGRVSFEMVQKAATAGISLIIAVGAPTSLAIELCVEWDIGLIGFIKADQFNVYHGVDYLT